jgi:hypothetical protein
VIRLLTLVFSAILMSGCFGGVKKTGKVTGYKPGQVITKKGFYRVGVLPEAWTQVDLGIAAITFHNPSLNSSISTDAYCDQAYDDSSLEVLTKHLFPGLQKIKIQKETPLMLDQREALRTSLQASLDGVPVQMETVVVKKNWCLFDFYLVSTPEKFIEALPYFESFYQAFSYPGEI